MPIHLEDSRELLNEASETSGRRIEKERGGFARIAKNDMGRAYGDVIMLLSTPGEIPSTFLFY
jgi:hypothetical protein